MKIEFRGKDIKTGEWRYGNIIHSLDTIDDFDSIIIPKTNNNMFASSDENSDLGFEGWYKVDPKTVGQYTNVDTPDGKKIFEDDYVLVKDCHPTGYDDFYGVVEFLEGAWWVDNELMQKAVLLWNESNEIEILGNIHDNPELLEVPK